MIFENRDCMEGMAEYPDNHFDIAIVDPPYRDACDNQPTEIMRKKGGMKTWQNKPTIEYFNELKRVSKEQIIFGGNYFTDMLEPNNNWIIWYKNNEGVKYSMCELAWVSINIKYTQLFQYRPMGNLSGIHPTEKPIALYKWIISKYCKTGMKILDSHVGSASSLIAFEEFGLDYVGYELDPEYYAAAKTRIEKYRQQLKLFPAGFDS